MKITLNIALTELRSLFCSPIAWIVIIVFCGQTYGGIMGIVGNFLREQELGRPNDNLTIEMLGARGYSLFRSIMGYLYVYIPLLTMGLMSREYGSGSIKLLYSSPVRNSQIIVGKYIAMVAIALAMVLLLLVPVSYMGSVIENFDWPIALSGLLGVFLLICAYSAIGLFMSSLTSYQIVAMIGTGAILFVLDYVGHVGQRIGFVRDITYWLDISGRADTFYRGLVSSENVAYFVLITALFISLAVIRLRAVRRRGGGVGTWLGYVAVVAAFCMAGYATSRPAMKLYHDSTRTEQLTLTPNSRDIIAKAAGPLTITTYVNILDSRFFYGLPQLVNSDKARFEMYTRFKPEIRMKYVYYYAMPENTEHLERKKYSGTDEEIVATIAKAYRLDPGMFRPVNEIDVRDILEKEKYRFVRILSRGSGEWTPLRIFNDMMAHPGEPEVSAAIERLVGEVPTVGFAVGNGERDVADRGDRGYHSFADAPTSRYALVNQGFDVERITFDAPVPEYIGIVVIAEMRGALTPVQKANLEEYIGRGGNVLLAGDVGRQATMNPVAEKFGVRFLPGRIVGNEASGTTDVALGIPAPQSAAMAYGFGDMLRGGKVAVMPGCTAIDYDTDKGFDVTPMFMSGGDCWNELQTTDFVDDKAVFDPATGEREGPLPMGVALTRTVGDKLQKVLVLGDADCMSNEWIYRDREGVDPGNFDMAMAAFFWFSDGRMPIDVRRPAPTDNMFTTDEDAYSTAKLLIVWGVPALFLVVLLLIGLRRKRR